MIKSCEITLPAAWASALVNGNIEDLEFNAPEEARKCRDWIKENDDIGRVVDVGTPYTDQFIGKTTLVSNYTAYLKQQTML